MNFPATSLENREYILSSSEHLTSLFWGIMDLLITGSVIFRALISSFFSRGKKQEPNMPNGKICFKWFNHLMHLFFLIHAISLTLIYSTPFRHFVPYHNFLFLSHHYTSINASKWLYQCNEENLSFNLIETFMQKNLFLILKKLKIIFQRLQYSYRSIWHD